MSQLYYENHHQYQEDLYLFGPAIRETLWKLVEFHDTILCKMVVQELHVQHNGELLYYLLWHSDLCHQRFLFWELGTNLNIGFLFYCVRVLNLPTTFKWICALTFGSVETWHSYTPASFAWTYFICSVQKPSVSTKNDWKRSSAMKVTL